MKFSLTVFIILLLNVPLLSRDIDLDRIYLKSGSRIYRDITALKGSLYTRISSLYVDRNVIYAFWSGGEDILYIKEFSGINIAYIYSRGNMTRREIFRFPGTVTAAVNNCRGSLVTFKSIFYNSNAEAESINIHIDLASMKVIEEQSSSLFLDFSPYPASGEIISRGREGLIKKDPFTGVSSKIISQDQYNDMPCKSEPVIAYISPDKRRKLLICGSGGVYTGKLITGGSASFINGIASAADARWITGNTFVYRSGGAGDYSVRVHNAETGKSAGLISGTMNPDIHFSERPALITCLENQMINIFSADLKTRINTGLEGEETSVSPDGRRLISIYQGRLYVTGLSMIEKYQIEIRRNSAELLSLYRKAFESRGDWENDFTPEYLSKKISQYEKFLQKEGRKR